MVPSSLVAPHVYVGVVCPTIGQTVNQPRIGVERENQQACFVVSSSVEVLVSLKPCVGAPMAGLQRRIQGSQQRSTTRTFSSGQLFT